MLSSDSGMQKLVSLAQKRERKTKQYKFGVGGERGHTKGWMNVVWSHLKDLKWKCVLFCQKISVYHVFTKKKNCVRLYLEKNCVRLYLIWRILFLFTKKVCWEKSCSHSQSRIFSLSLHMFIFLMSRMWFRDLNLDVGGKSVWPPSIPPRLCGSLVGDGSLAIFDLFWGGSKPKIDPPSKKSVPWTGPPWGVPPWWVGTPAFLDWARAKVHSGMANLLTYCTHFFVFRVPLFSPRGKMEIVQMGPDRTQNHEKPRRGPGTKQF